MSKPLKIQYNLIREQSIDDATWNSNEARIERADIEGSKSNVAMNAWLPQASYPSKKGGQQS
jgi:hypothetical protein